MSTNDMTLKNIILKDETLTILTKSGEKLYCDSVQNYTLRFYDVRTPIIGKNYLEIILSHPAIDYPIILKAKDKDPMFEKLKDFCKYMKKNAKVDIVQKRSQLIKPKKEGEVSYMKKNNMREQNKRTYTKWNKGYILFYRVVAIILIIFGVLCLISIVGWILGLIALLFSFLLLYVARCAEKGMATKESSPPLNNQAVNRSAPNLQIQHNTDNSDEENTSPSNNLLYEHNHFKFDLFDSFTVKDTGEKWISVYKYENVEIYRPDTSFSEIFEYDIVDIVPEPNNPYDPNAVAVQFHGNVLGYLYKGTIQDMVHDFLKRNELIRATIQKIDVTKIYLKMYFCKPRSLALPYQDSIAVKLSSNTNEDMQQNIACCNIGNKISVDFDYDKEKYSVFCDDLEIGYIPKSQQDIIKDLENKKYEFEGEIIDISENQSEKYVITVKIQPQ